MKTILVPIDYSANSRNALIYALEMAGITGAEIILFHAFYPIMSPPASLNTTDVILALEEGKARSLRDFALATQAETAPANRRQEVTIKAVARMGGSYEMILQAISKYNADLVVMGMQGGGALRQALLGSTTISVMQESPVPILAVPEKIPFRHFTTVVFATNLSRMPANADLHALQDFVKVFDAKLKVLHLYTNSLQFANSDQLAAMEQLAGKLQGIDVGYSFALQESIADGIQRFIQEQQADLLVLIPRPHSFLERLLDKSITGQLTAHPQVPVLALPAAILRSGTSMAGKEAAAG